MMDTNCVTLEQHRDEIQRIADERGSQAAIDYCNSLIDCSLGIVAGDGAYYPRLVNGVDPFQS